MPLSWINDTRFAQRWAERFAHSSLWALSALVLGLAGVGTLVFDRYDRGLLRQEAGEYLAALTSLKAREIDAWLHERRGDASVAGRLPAFSRAVAGHVAGAPGAEFDATARELAAALRESYDYLAVFALGADGRLLLGTSDRGVSSPQTRAAVRAAVEADAPRVSDLWAPYAGASPLIDVAAPIHGPAADGGGLIGVVVLRIDPRLRLWPLLASWPDASYDGHVTLARDEGAERLLFDVTRAAAGDVVEPRRASNARGSAFEHAPPGQLVRSGTEESGREVLAAAREIAGTGWTLVVTIPIADVEASAGRATLLALGWLLALFGGAAVLARRHARRSSDAAVRASEELLRISQALAHSGSWEWQPRARSFAFSPELTRVLGVPGQQLPTPRRLLRQVPASGRRALLGALRVALRDGKRMSLEHDVRRPDGQLRIVQHEAKRYAGAKRATRLVGVIIDVTERRRTERALRESQVELVAAREAALAAAQVKARFLANISHEIRTPLNAIVGLSHLLSAAVLAPNERAMLRKLEGATRSLLDLINGVLDYSKLEAGKLQLAATPFFLDEVLDAVTNVVAVEAQQKGLQLSFSLSESVPMALVGDAVRLRQVLTNLTHNAVKFTTAGEIVVGVEPLESPAGRARLRFSVRDTGLGIAPEEVPKLFAAFTQADDSATRRFGGTGLGLAISAEIVQLMGGHIDVDSTPGSGSTFAFTIELPLSTEQRQLPPRAGFGPARALVVDDHVASLLVLGRYLRDLGFTVESARSGPEALQQLSAAEGRGEPFDLLLIDWRLPGPSGLDTARGARQELCAPPPIIVVTAHESEARIDPQDRIEAVLIKPVTRSALLDAIALTRGQAVPPREIAAAPAILKGARVLVAEDNEINQQVARQLLESAGVRVHLVGNGREAVAATASPDARFDAVLMDLQMPEMDGYEATRAIRNQPRSAALPIIAMTAHTLALEKERCLQAGMNAHVAKPIDPAALFATLARWIVTPPEPAPSAALDIPGIDCVAALNRVRQNRDLLLRLLAELARSWRDADARIRELLARSEREEARRTAHTLRGAAANLGAGALAEAASRVERALGGADPNATDAAITDLHAVLSNVCTTLDERLPALTG